MEEAPAAQVWLPQWKLPTPALLLLLILVVLVAVSLCISTLLKNKQASCSAQNRQVAAGEQSQDPAGELPSHPKINTIAKRSEVLELLRSLFKKLLGGSSSACWSRSLADGDGLHDHQYYDHESCTGGAAEQQAAEGGGWDMPTPRAPVAASPIWGRRILMGGRCQMPRFSGVILYDDKGVPLGHSSGIHAQDKLKAAGITTLRDLL